MASYDEMRLDSCYHEAAHAVFDYRAGFAIRYVSVETPGRYDLRDVCMSETTMAPTQAVQVASGLLAGELAVYRLRGEQKPAVEPSAWAEVCLACVEEAWDGGDDNDDVRAFRLLSAAVDHDVLPSVEVGYEEARSFAALHLSQWWSVVIVVAEALREQGRLEGDACTALMAAAF